MTDDDNLTRRQSFDAVRYAASIEAAKVRRYDRITEWCLAVAVGVGFAFWLLEALQ
jgi:hypothetical protein